MKVPTLADEDDVKRIANKACEDARKEFNLSDHPVNWEDLGFIRVVIRPYVLVKEASSGARELQEFIEGRLRDAGFDVGVETAWGMMYCKWQHKPV